jgi:hypothetical protein
MSSPATRQLIGRRAATSRLILIAATLASFGIGLEHGSGALIAPAVLGIAAAQVRLIGLDFMDLRFAPAPPLRGLFEGYCLLLWAVLSGLYLWL